MDSKKLEALLLSVDLGSFTKASEVLGYTQSGLTHMMDSLEKEIGFPVLERGHFGIRLTAEGKVILPAIRKLIQASTNLDNSIAQVRSSRNDSIRVAAYASIAMHWLPSIIQQFRAEHPDVDVDIRMADSLDSAHALLAEGKMDTIFVSNQEHSGFDWVHLQDDTMYAVLPKDYPVGDCGVFPLSEFDGKEFIMPAQGFDRDILRIFNRAGVRPDIRPTMVDDSTVVSMVEHGLGISMMTELTLKGRTRHIRVVPVEPSASRELGMAFRSLSSISPILREFIDCTQRTVARLSEETYL